MPLTSPATAVTCRVDDHLIALRATDVAEVLPMVELSMAPEMPPLLHGFLALHDQLIPVVRLEGMLGISLPTPVPLTPERALERKLILARCGDSMLGLVCENPGLLGYRQEELIPVPEGHVLNACCEKMIPHKKGSAIPLLEPARLRLEEERLAAMQLADRLEERLSAVSLQ